MLLAAGLGTRLSPLTNERPKPVVPVGYEPLCMDAVRTFQRAGVRRLDVNAFHLPDVLERELAPRLPGDVETVFHRETTILGTGGGIRAALVDRSDDDVLVMNGDIRFTPDVPALMAHHRASGASVTLVVRHHPDPFALGAVEVDATGQIIRIAGGPASDAQASAAYVFTGVHWMSAGAYAWLPNDGCVVRRAYQPMLQAGVRLSAFVDDSPWADLGTVPVYMDANLREARASDDPRGLIHAQAVIGARAEITQSVVGLLATIDPAIRLKRCVVWSGAHVRESLSDCVVTRSHVVRLSL